MITRAYSLFDVKTIQEDQRVIEGIASTPTTDRMDDILEPLGAQFTLPISALLFHDSKNPVAVVEMAKATKQGVTFRMRFPKAGLIAKVDEAWNYVKSGLIRAVSVGFRELESTIIKETGGLRFTKWELLEISLVSIPANAEALITSVKSFDSDCTILAIKSADVSARALSGAERGIVRLGKSFNSPGVPGQPQKDPMKIREQITSFENKRAASDARMSEIMTKAGDDGRTLDETEQQEYDGLESEIKKIDAHLVRLKAQEARNVSTATAVDAALSQDPATAQRAAESHRGGSIIQVKSNQPKGIGMARMVMAMANGMLSYQNPIEIAKRRWPDSPEVALAVKSVVEAGDTTTSGWASQLVPAAQALNDEFLELWRPGTIIGKLPLNQVPFNVSVPVETASGTAQWVGEGAPKPVTKLTLSNVTLTWAKAAAIVAITEELAKFSRPDAEMVVRNSMVKTLVEFFDLHFVSSLAAVAGISPAGILNGISATATTGTSAAAFRTDMTTLLAKLTVNKVPLSGIYIIMSSTQAVALSLMVTDLGVALFPSITRDGGTILGFPVVISEAVGTKIIAINPNSILLASDPGVSVATSREATIEMDDAPAGGETSPVTTISTLKSAFQNNLIFIRVEQFITWKRGRDAAVEYLNGVAYKS